MFWVNILIWIGLTNQSLSKSYLISELEEKHFNLDKYQIWGVNKDGHYLVTGNGIEERRTLLSSLKNVTHSKQFNRHKHRTKKALVVTGIEHLDPIQLFRSSGIVSNHDMRFKEISFAGLKDNAVIVRFLDPATANHTLELLKSNPDVLFIDYIRKHNTTRDYAIQHVIGLPDATIDLSNGFGVPIAISDTGLDTDHVFFKDFVPYPKYEISGKTYSDIHKEFSHYGHKKIMAYLSIRYYDIETEETIATDFSDMSCGHGTHVSGIAAGYSPNVHSADSHSRILFIDLQRSSIEDGPLDMPDSIWWILQTVYNSGVRIFSNSWGSPGCDYTATAFEIDLFVYRHPDMAIIFSAGNSGPDRCTIASPAVSKSVISVGSSYNTYPSWLNYSQMPSYWENSSYFMTSNETILKNDDVFNERTLSEFSSRGPTQDGRIKPDTVAPGEWIKSARAGTERGELLMRGTSQSAPLVAHILSIVDEKLKTIYKIDHPLASLRRAILVACSYPMKDTKSVGELIDPFKHRLVIGNKTKVTTGEDDGFGALHMSRFFSGRLSMINALTLSEYDASTWKKMVFDVKGSSPVDVVIVIAYTDVPSVSVERLLVNDVNMRVAVFRRGRIAYLANGNNAGGYGDALNPTERVRFVVEPGDEVHLTIGTMSSLAFRKQDVSIVYSSELVKRSDMPTCTKFDLPRRCLGKSTTFMKCLNKGSFDPESCLKNELKCTSVFMCGENEYSECGGTCDKAIKITRSKRRSLKSKPDRLDHISTYIWAYFMFGLLMFTLFSTMVILNDLERRYEAFIPRPHPQKY